MKLCILSYEFNFNILHNIIPCSRMVNKCNMNISGKCKRCSNIENTHHMLYACTHIKCALLAKSDKLIFAYLLAR